MTSEQIKQYLFALLDMEKNCYIQKNTLKKLYITRNSLGNYQDIPIPSCKKAEAEYGDFMITAAFFGGIIGFIIGTIVRWGEFWKNNGIFGIVGSLLFGLFIALICAAVAGLIIGPIIAASKMQSDQSKYDANYQNEMQEYDRLKREDEIRVRAERITRSQVQHEIDLFEAKYNESLTRLGSLYNYNIIHREYWYNIIAIASFYQYFDKKITYSLEFNPQTGDIGAYKIYEDEMRLGQIISKLDQVLDKLDQIIENQQTLQRTLRDANNTISYLSNNISQIGNRLNASIQEQTALQAYNAERTQAELQYMNLMNTLFSWH